MKRKIIAITLFLTLLLAFTGLMSACTQVGEIPVTAVVVEETSIFLSTSEVSNTAQIRPTIYPADATNQKVVFSSDVQNYVTVTSSGLVTANKETEEGSPIQIRVSSAENDKIYATVYVTVENVEAEEVVFTPSTKEVYLGSDPFQLAPGFIPSHASVGIELNYESQNTEVATVDSDGMVTIVGVGTAHVRAVTFSGAEGYFKIIVKYIPPLYGLEWSDSDVENFNQEPGVPKPINFTLVPKGQYCDPEPKIVWSDGRNTIDAALNDGLLCTYVPSENVTPGEYVITVTITDRDDQVQVLKSPTIKIYSSLLIEGMTFVNNGSYSIEYGDRISRSIQIAEGQRPPDGYTWYYYSWDEDRETEYAGDGSASDIYDFIITNKQKPTRTGGDGDFTAFATSTSNRDEQNFSGTLEADGTVYIFVVPEVAGETRYDLFCGDPKPYTVTSSGKTEIYNLHTSYGYEGVTFMPKLAWSTLAGSKEYVVEITTIDSDGSELETKSYYSDQPSDEKYFVGSTFVLPSDTYNLSQRFRARVKVQNNGTTWSDYVEYQGETKASDLRPYYTGVMGEDIGYGAPNLGLDLYMYDMRELGTLLNYLRVLRPDIAHNASDSAYLVSVESESGAYSHKYNVGLALTFSSVASNVGLGTDGKSETRKIVYMDGRQDDDNYSDILLETKPVSTDLPNYQQMYDMMQMSQTLLLAFAAYCESGVGQFAVTSTEYNAVDHIYYVQFSYYVNADDVEVTYVTTESKVNIYDKTVDNEILVSTVTPGDEKIDYFSGNDNCVEVTTSDQLFIAAQMGLKPIPVAGSAAEAVYQELVAVMDTIVAKNLADGRAMSDRMKVIAIYEWLTSNVYYDHYAANAADVRSSDAVFRMEGVFGIGTAGSRKMSVCEGYAKAFATMCWMVDVPCIKIPGMVNGEGHVWNTVFVDGEWSIVDATWGAVSNSVRIDGKNIESQTHMYLFRSYDFISSDHNTFGRYPDTATEEYSYYKQVGAYGTDPNAYDIITYLIGINGVLNALTASNQVISVDIAINASALTDSSTPLNDYLNGLISNLSGYTGDYATLTPGGYGSGEDRTYIIKLYIKKL